ncbi:LysR substrate-binding domain-containing protein [Pseudomonas oryzihabitans]|uniref:LysR family glycine cleavage system transcriptional activator n=1 Tax=Pseudomonas oryzihabitans TaxID=47885 RepID=A0AAJ2BH75_9PSED|nr:LysR substrate-binding domain-containing protein [Pseudomonas psychrotolerans]MDR6234196.1 LysR family glycine cleavage system transcriptional activator [Pseudomonas psychrotolerans]MDR6356694.1 LysR family glycine cleavage system transcriptional activator [Pseudomonas psychrotolerans]
MSRLPPLNALRCFEAVARLGSVTRAASELHLTHAAVSQQVKGLEHQLGMVLFERQGRGIEVTGDGRAYAEQVRQLLADLGEATRRLQARPRRNELVFATFPSFATHWLLPRLPRFRALHPEYRIRIQTSMDFQDLRQGMVDIGVRLGEGQWDGLTALRLFQDDVLLVAAPDYNGGRLPRTLDEALAQPVMHTEETWRHWGEAAGRGQAMPSCALGVNDSNLVLEALRLGQTLALERRSLVQTALEQGRLVQLSPVVAPYPYTYWLVWPERAESVEKQAHFTAWIQAEVATYLATLGTPTPGQDAGA